MVGGKDYFAIGLKLTIGRICKNGTHGGLVGGDNGKAGAGRGTMRTVGRLETITRKNGAKLVNLLVAVEELGTGNAYGKVVSHIIAIGFGQNVVGTYAVGEFHTARHSKRHFETACTGCAYARNAIAHHRVKRVALGSVQHIKLCARLKSRIKTIGNGQWRTNNKNGSEAGIAALVAIDMERKRR